LGKDGDATITINLNGTMIIDGWGIGDLNEFAIDSDDLGTDSYIDLVGGTLKVVTEDTLFPSDKVIGYGGTRGVGVTVDGVYDVYTALPYGAMINAPDYEWLVDDTKTVAITATVTDPDTSGHTYTWTSTSGATFAGQTFALISGGVTLTADVTFDTAGDHSLTVEVADSVKGLIYTDDATFTVYADGCVAAKTETGYDEAAALLARDANFDCEVNLADVAVMAVAWYNSVSY
jgi:hypothetical protein